MHRKSKQGFTLIEIVISMMFLSFGIMGVIALFFVGVTNGNLSIEHQKATIIAMDVKEALLNALKYPRIEVIENTNKTYKLYRLELPGTVDTQTGGPGLSPEDLIENDKRDDPKSINGFYFQISDDTKDLKNAEQKLNSFTDEEPIDTRVLDLPYEGITFNGDQLKNQVWKYRPYKFYDIDSDYDEDDSNFYSFRIILRRSVRYPTTGQLSQGDLLVATVYVFKQYDVTALGDDEGNVDKLTFMKYDEDYGCPTFEIDEEGNTDSSIQPIVKYEFYLPA